MRLSATALDFIKQHEAFVATPYTDPGGYLTIGYGHRIKSGERFTRLSHEEALQILANDVGWAEDAVNRLVSVPLTQSMFDALVSLTFNWGDGPKGFSGSTLLQKLNAGDYQGAAQRLSIHPITSDGRTLPGLIRRRKEESVIFLREGIPGSAYQQQAAAEDPRSGWNAGAGADTESGLSITTWLMIGGGFLLLMIVLDD